MFFFFFSSRRRHTRSKRDWSSDVCSSDLPARDPYANAASPSGYSASGTCGYGNGNGQALDKLFGTNNFNGSTKITENTATNRSEERRVGKEGKTRRSTEE